MAEQFGVASAVAVWLLAEVAELRVGDVPLFVEGVALIFEALQ